MKPILLLLFIIILASTACKKRAYEVNEVSVAPPNADKSKMKTEEQFLSILYANLFQQALSADELVELTNLIMSVGDKDLIHEVVISNFMNQPAVILPSDSLMRADIDGFMIETYDRFLVRPPSEAEKTWFRNFLNAHPTLSAEMVYFAFALCHEYLFY